MAEAFFRYVIKGKIESSSAGVFCFPGLKVSKNSELVMKEHEIDVSHHISKQLTREMITQADLVVVMEPTHKKGLVTLYPEFAQKIFLLKEFSKDCKDKNISDPFDGDLDEYKKCFEEIKLCVLGLIKCLSKS